MAVRDAEREHQKKLEQLEKERKIKRWQDAHPNITKEGITISISREAILRKLFQIKNISAIMPFKQFKSSKMNLVRDELIEELEEALSI